MNTPWGHAQQVDHVADGITIVSTASHGGCKLSAERNALVPESMRSVNGWYEEDCEINFCVWTFPDEFAAWSCEENYYPPDSPYRDPVRSKEVAAESIRQWFPDVWTAATGEDVTAEQSHVVAEREFKAAHADDFITVAAWGSWHDAVPEGFVGVAAVRGGRGSGGEEGHFLLPEAEYQQRFNHGSVVDLDRHQRWDGPEAMTKQVHAA